MIDKAYTHSPDPEVAVYGLGVTGLAAVQFFERRGILSRCWDDRPERRAEAPRALLWEFLKFGTPDGIRDLILSPGLPWNGVDKNHPIAGLADRARQCGVRVCSDIDWLLANGKGLSPPILSPDVRCLGVTGTNGKTSVCLWLEAILQAGGQDAIAVGNNGVAALQDHHRRDHLVVELSSYQLDLARHPGFDRGLLLNISPDHLERYGTMERYVESKARLLKLIKPGGTVAISMDDEHCRGLASQAEKMGLEVVRFSVSQRIVGGIYLENGQIIDHRGAVPMLALDCVFDTRLDCLQHMRNLTAVFALLPADARDHFGEWTLQAIDRLDFSHRQNPVAAWGRHLCVDDSKATNPIAAADALRQFRHVHWIAGGQAKQGGFDDLNGSLNDVEAVYLIGQGAVALEEFLRPGLPKGVPITVCGRLDEAVEMVESRLGRESEAKTVLLSPACASFDQFANYAERGRAFTEAVTTRGAKPWSFDEPSLPLGAYRRSARGDAPSTGVPYRSLTDADVDSGSPAFGTSGSERLIRWLMALDKTSVIGLLIVFGFGLMTQSIAEGSTREANALKHGLIGGAGLIGMLVLSALEKGVVKRLIYVLGIASLFAMIAVLFVGQELNQARRWLSFAGLGFQPIEIYKFASVSVLALLLGYQVSQGIGSLGKWACAIAFWLISIVLILPQPDTSQFVLSVGGQLTALLLALTWSFLPLLIALLLLGFFGFFFFLGLIELGYLQHVRRRIDGFFTDEVTQAEKIAGETLRNAELFGSIGDHVPQWSSIPYVSNDYVFALMLQEYGLLLSLVPVVLLFVVLGRLSLRLRKVDDIGARCCGSGLVLIVFGQICLNIGTGTQVIPSTGLTLPFISSGGSALLGTCLAFGLLLHLTREDHWRGVT